MWLWYMTNNISKKRKNPVDTRLGLEALFINGNELSALIRKDSMIINVMDQRTQESHKDKYTLGIEHVNTKNIIRLLSELKPENKNFDMHGVRMCRHENGGGWVQDSVAVDYSNYIPSTAMVFGNNDIRMAQIGEHVIIGNPYEPATENKRILSGPLI